MQILQGPIIIGIGFAFGIFWGLICIWIPSRMEVSAINKKLDLDNVYLSNFLVDNVMDLL